MKALLLAGGLGTRMRPLTFAVPKPLLPIGDLTILEANLRWLRSQGIQDVAISLGWRAEVIKSYIGKSRSGFDIHYVQDDQPLGTAGPMALVRDWLGKDNLFVMNGDILTDLNMEKLSEFHEERKSGLTVCVKSYVTKSRFGVVHTRKDAPDLLVNVVEKPEYRETVSAGMYLVSPETLNFIPTRTHYTMPQLIYDCNLNVGEVAHVYRFNESWVAVEDMSDWERVSADSDWLEWIEVLKSTVKG